MEKIVIILQSLCQEHFQGVVGDISISDYQYSANQSSLYL